MKKKLISRGLMGFPLGVFIGYIVTILISICAGDGNYYPSSSTLNEVMSSEINAVILQAALSGILGSVCGCISLIWEIDSWSIVKQSGIYFAVFSCAMFPIAYVCHWMEHSVHGVLSYAGIFILIFLVTWIFQYVTYKIKINRINSMFKKS